MGDEVSVTSFSDRCEITNPSFLAASGGPLGVDTEAIIRAILGIEPEDDVLDVNADRRINAADVMTNLEAR